MMFGSKYPKAFRRENVNYHQDAAEELMKEACKKYKNVYPFSDGIFKMLLANEAKPERTVQKMYL